MKENSNVSSGSDKDIDMMLLTLLYLVLTEDISMEKLWMKYVEEIKLKRRFSLKVNCYKK